MRIGSHKTGKVYEKGKEDGSRSSALRGNGKEMGGDLSARNDLASLSKATIISLVPPYVCVSTAHPKAIPFAASAL
eukprot:2186668-Rhodomonas_salina.4